ncbi:MAG: 3-dehydroquinate synthase [Actinomycetota bacterium]
MSDPRRLEVHIPGSPYDLWIGPGLLERSAEFLGESVRGAEICALVSDAHVAGLHGERARRGLRDTGLRLEEFTVEPGEVSKSLGTAEVLWRWLAHTGAHRSDVVVALGGGVVGDLGGFVAATYHRGMPVVHMPTTLLGQVDSSIGGKTAIDLPEGKNLVGAFHQPRVVICDTDSLATLPEGAFATGLAEVVKHGFIGAPDLLQWLRSERDAILAREPETLELLVADAAAVKIGVVEEDETEQGTRAHLNYGHTLGHALEVLGGYTRWTHGQAVAVGMMFAAHLAAELGLGDRVAAHRDALESFGLPVGAAGEEFDRVAEAWRRDKKFDSGTRFVVLEDVGSPVVVRDVPERALRASYEAVR